MAVKPAVPIAIACRLLSASGTLTSQPALTRAFWAKPPQWRSPSPQPVRTTRSPGAKSGDAESSTVPEKSIPGTWG